MPLFKTRLVPLLLLFTAMAVRAGEVQVELSGLQDAAGDLYITVYDSEDSWLGEERVMDTPLCESGIIGAAVGMALAERMLAETFNRDGLDIVDHRTWVFTGDGCLMEGISHEACSLAGTLGLGKLVAFWDDNGISIDGHVEGWFTDDTPGRFESYGWHVIAGVDGHDPAAIDNAIAEANTLDWFLPTGWREVTAEGPRWLR